MKAARRVGAALKGKVVLFVSVAEDLGYELATPLAKCGCRIVLAGSSSSSSSSSQLQATSSNLKSLGLETAQVVELDVRAGEASIDAAVGRAWDVYGTIDVLVYCSTVPGTPKSPLDHSVSDWDDVMAVNLKAPWLVSRAVAQRMKAAQTQTQTQKPRGGSILFVSYISGLERGFCPGDSVHGAALAGLHQLSKYMGMELGKYGIMVAVVARGWSEADPMLASRSEQEIEKAGKKMPLQRWTDPVPDLQGLVALLASDYGHYLTSNVFIADGGQSLVRARMKSSL